uniref:Uncharacterized protein n=1 Tax=Podoviridae sp. ctJYR5 TaxID=2826551 RepID=A0A8S5N027_9CAUD|nr:MAG TPA: hypothetical protein [Podoviridae sp. ctJYR5]
MNGAVIGPLRMEGTEMEAIKTLLGASAYKFYEEAGKAFRLGRLVKGAWCLMAVMRSSFSVVGRASGGA